MYTQHTPLLTSTLTMLSQDKLDLGAYPYMAGTQDESVSYQVRREASATRTRQPGGMMVVREPGGMMVVREQRLNSTGCAPRGCRQVHSPPVRCRTTTKGFLHILATDKCEKQSVVQRFVPLPISNL